MSRIACTLLTHTRTLMLIYEFFPSSCFRLAFVLPNPLPHEETDSIFLFDIEMSQKKVRQKWMLRDEGAVEAGNI